MTWRSSSLFGYGNGPVGDWLKGVALGMRRTMILALAVLLLLTSIGMAAPKEMNLRVAEPGEAAEWKLGTANTIKWSFRGELGQNVAIRLQRMGWVNAQMTLSEATPLGANRSGSFKWDLPADLPPGGKYTIAVTAENGIGDTSGEFTLVAGKGPATQIKVEALPKGERWAAGTTVSIRWTYGGSPGQTVKLALIKKAEGDVTVISASVPIGAEGKGRYEWKVPSLKPGTDYYIGIVSNSNAFYQDMGVEPVILTATK